MIEEKDYDVAVSITFKTNVRFMPIERDGALTKQDALANFYGYGLDKIFASGEYAHTIDSETVLEYGNERDALDEVARILRDPDWGVGMLEDISQLVAFTGRDVDGDGSKTWDRH